MTTGGKVVVFLGKWVLIPIGLGFAGYYLVGPQIGKTPGLEKVLPKRPVADTQAPAPEQTPISKIEDSRSKLSAPDVEVTAEPVTRRRSSPPRRRTRTEESKRARDEAALPPVDDPASSGGMDDAPTTPPESDPASGGGAAG